VACGDVGRCLVRGNAIANTRTPRRGKINTADEIMVCIERSVFDGSVLVKVMTICVLLVAFVTAEKSSRMLC